MAMRSRLGCINVLLILLLPAFLAAYLLHSVKWLVIVPAGMIGIVFLVAAMSGGRKKEEITAEQLADKLERHLLRTEKNWDWDDLTSCALADERLERMRWMVLDPRFDSLKTEKDRDDFKVIIATLRRGDIPEVVPPTSLKYP